MQKHLSRDEYNDRKMTSRDVANVQLTSTLSSDASFNEITSKLVNAGIISLRESVNFRRSNFLLGSRVAAQILLHCLELKNNWREPFSEAWREANCEILRRMSDETSIPRGLGFEATIDCVKRLRNFLVDEYTRNVPPYPIFEMRSGFRETTYIPLDMAPYDNPTERVPVNAEILANFTATPSVPMLILGEAGQGKTTFVRKLAYDWAIAQRGGRSDANFKQFSLLLAYPLRNLEGNFEKIIDFLIVSELSCGFEASEVESVKTWICDHPAEVLVVLDGFDEIGGKCAELERVVSSLEPDTADFALIVTARSYDLQKICPSELRFHICDLSSSQTLELVEKHGRDFPRRLVDEIIDFCGQDENEFVVSSPHFVHLLCCAVIAPGVNADWKPHFPCSKSDIFRAVISWLCTRRKSKKPSGNHDFIRALSAVAFELQWSNRFLCSQSDLDSFAGHQISVEAIELGLLEVSTLFYGSSSKLNDSQHIDENDVKLCFAHRSFQEFFAALHFVKRFDEKGNFGKWIDRIFGRSQRNRRETLILDDDDKFVQVQRGFILFAVGLVAETREASRLIQLVGPRLLYSISSGYDSDKGRFVLTFLKAFFNEATSPGRTAVKNWAISSSTDFARFAEAHCKSHFFDSEKSPINDLIEGLLPVGVGVSALSVAATNVAFVPSKNRFVVCEVFSECTSASGKEKFEKSMTVRDFRFDGTACGLQNFVSRVSVLCLADAYLLICPPRGASVSSGAVGRLKAFMKIDLRLSTQFVSAHEVRSTFEILSTCVFHEAEVAVSFFVDRNEQAPLPMPKIDGIEEPIVIRINELNLRKDVTFSPLAFLALMQGVDEIDRLWISDEAYSILDGFGEGQIHEDLAKTLARVHSIAFSVSDLLPLGVAFSKFVAVVKPTSVKISFLIDSSTPKVSFDYGVLNASFRGFCEALADEKDVRNDLKLVAIWCAWFVKADLLFEAIVDSLVDLLRRLPELRLSFQEELSEKVSLFPLDLRSRVFAMPSL